jgi:hypothetical protein
MAKVSEPRAWRACIILAADRAIHMLEGIGIPLGREGWLQFNKTYLRHNLSRHSFRMALLCLEYAREVNLIETRPGRAFLDYRIKEDRFLKTRLPSEGKK